MIINVHKCVWYGEIPIQNRVHFEELQCAGHVDRMEEDNVNAGLGESM
jgi:hypothetical protein